MNDVTRPKITIGLPVYNGAKFIHNAIRSLLKQSYTNFELLISDNASTDQTESVCRNFAKTDKRIKYTRHETNSGYVWNFNSVLQQADTEYFMWAGADDVWHPEFIERNLSFLEKNQGFIGSTSEVDLFYETWEEKDFERFKNIKPNKKHQWLRPLVGNYEDKVRFLFTFHIFDYAYSIYRTEILKKCIIKKKFLSWEIPVILKLLKYGDLNVEDVVMTYKYMGSKTDIDYRKKLFRHTRKQDFGILLSIFPFVPLTIHVLTVVGPKIFFKYLLKGFIKDNYRAQRLVFLDIFSRGKIKGNIES